MYFTITLWDTPEYMINTLKIAMWRLGYFVSQTEHNGYTEIVYMTGFRSINTLENAIVQCKLSGIVHFTVSV